MEVNYAGYRDYYMNRKTLSGCNPGSNQLGTTVHEFFRSHYKDSPNRGYPRRDRRG